MNTKLSYSASHVTSSASHQDLGASYRQHISNPQTAQLLSSSYTLFYAQLPFRMKNVTQDLSIVATILTCALKANAQVFRDVYDAQIAIQQEHDSTPINVEPIEGFRTPCTRKCSS